MVFFWRGWGFLALVIMVAIALLTQLAVNALLGQKYYETHNWPVLVACSLQALIVWFLGRRLNMESNEYPGFEPQLADWFKLNLNGKHTLFFIPLEFWAFIFLGFGIYTAFQRPECWGF